MFGLFARMDTGTVLDGHPSLVTFYQPELEGVLRRRLQQAPDAEVRLGTVLEAFSDDGTCVTATVRTAGGETERPENVQRLLAPWCAAP